MSSNMGNAAPIPGETDRKRVKRSSCFLRLLLILAIVALAAFGVQRLSRQVQSLPPKAERVLAASRLYRAARDAYCYFEEDGTDWDAAYEAAVREVLAAKDCRAYLRALEEFRANLKDRHYDGAIFSAGTSALTDLGVLPFYCAWMDGGYVVLRSTHDQIAVGDVLRMIDGQDAHAWLEANIGPVVATGTPGARENMLAARFVFYYPRGKGVQCTFQNAAGESYSVRAKYGRNSEMTSISAAPNVTSGMEETVLLTHDAFTVTLLPDGVVWIANRSMGEYAYWDTFVGQVLPLIEDAKGVILDLRYNEGGNSLIGNRMLEAISGREAAGDSLRTEYPLSVGLDATYAALLDGPMGDRFDAALRQIAGQEAMAELRDRGAAMRNGAFRVTYEQYADMLALLNEAPPLAFDETAIAIPAGLPALPLVVLIGPNGGSAVDTVAQAAKDMGIVTLGTRTGGATGDVYTIDLGGGLITGFSSFYIMNTATGTPLNNHGIIADIQVDFSAEDIRDGLDTQVRAAWEMLR